MFAPFVQLDRVLRGELTRIEQLRSGSVPISLRNMVPVLVLLAMVNGVCMGFFALANRDPVPWMQLVASTVKVPALFLLTLVVTFPSLYVFNALVGSQLRVAGMARLIVAALGVTLALLASFGPIIAFFSFSTTSYPFMVFVNVITYAAAGTMGLAFLLRTLQRLAAARQTAVAPTLDVEALHVDAEDPEATAAALDRVDAGALGPHVNLVFRIWVVVFGVVGAQMAWVLRPFIGHPGSGFTWFRPRESSFFEGVWSNLMQLF